MKSLPCPFRVPKTSPDNFEVKNLDFGQSKGRQSSPPNKTQTMDQQPPFSTKTQATCHTLELTLELDHRLFSGLEDVRDLGQYNLHLRAMRKTIFDPVCLSVQGFPDSPAVS